MVVHSSNMEQTFDESDDSLLHNKTNIHDDTPSETSDSNSYTSDTPLIKDQSIQDFVDTPSGNHLTNMDKTNSYDSEIKGDRDQLSLSDTTYSAHLGDHSNHINNNGDSLIDINDFLEGCEEVEVHLHPLHIIGGGWECGSVSSLYHIAASREGVRGRLGTIERVSNQGSVTFLPHKRILSQVFANSLRSFQLSKKGSTVEGLNMPFTADKFEPPESKPKNFKNLFVVSIGLTILYFAIGGLRNLQSSLNSDGGIGVISLATTFAAFTVSSLISPYLVQMYRPKLCLIIGFTSHIFYVIANYCPRLVYFIPASVVLGFGNALTWNAACTYVTELGINEAEWKKKFPSHVLSRYFGFFFLIYQSSTVFGNLISSLILVPKSHTAIQSNDVFNSSILEILQTNDTSAPPSTASSALLPLSVCGVGFSDARDNISASLSVDEFDKLFLLGTYASCVIVAILTIVIFLDHLPNYMSKTATVREIVVQGKDVILMTMDQKFIFIVVLCFYTVVGNGFVVADTLKVCYSLL